MNLKWTTASLFALSASAYFSGAARADRYRIEEPPPVVRVAPDVDVEVRLRDVPPPVMNTVESIRHGRDIRWARYVSHEGRPFFVLRLERRHKEDLTVRIAPDGALLSVDRGYYR